MKVTELFEADERGDQFVEVMAFVPRPHGGGVGKMVDKSTLTPEMKKKLAAAKAKQDAENSMGAFRDRLKAVAATFNVKLKKISSYGKENADLIITGKRNDVAKFVQAEVMVPGTSMETCLAFVQENELA